MLFCLLSITHQGVRLWRKTYVVDMVEGNRRTDYVAVGNTLMSIFFFAVSSAVGCLLVRSLPEV
jgi:hypothetical protein